MAAIQYGQHNCVIQNCEFSWGGGGSQILENGRIRGRMGDALGGSWASGLTVSGNYFHDIFSHALIIEGNYDAALGSVKNVRVSDNLMERCDGINVVNEGGAFEGLVISDNIFTEAGLSWSARQILRTDMWTGVEWYNFIRIRQDRVFTDCAITGNAFYYPLQFFLYGSVAEDNLPKMSDNRFYAAQHTYGFACWAYAESGMGYESVALSRAKTFLRETLHDETGTVTIAKAQQGG